MRKEEKLEKLLQKVYHDFRLINKDEPKIILLNHNDFHLLYSWFLALNYLGSVNNEDRNKFRFMGCECVTWLPILKENEIRIY